MNCIETFTGRKIDPLAMSPDDVDIRDIAHSLALTCRFRGHTKCFYSVGQHSVLCSKHVNDVCQLANEGPNRGLRLWALLHDAPEAYLCDLPRPVKDGIRRAEALGDVRVVQRGEAISRFDFIEGNIMAAAALAFKLPLPMPDAIHRIDEAMLATEGRQFMSTFPEWQLKEKPLPIVIEPWSWERAEKEFLTAFEALKG